MGVACNSHVIYKTCTKSLFGNCRERGRLGDLDAVGSRLCDSYKICGDLVKNWVQ